MTAPLAVIADSFSFASTRSRIVSPFVPSTIALKRVQDHFLPGEVEREVGHFGGPLDFEPLEYSAVSARGRQGAVKPLMTFMSAFWNR